MHYTLLVIIVLTDTVSRWQLSQHENQALRQKAKRLNDTQKSHAKIKSKNQYLKTKKITIIKQSNQGLKTNLTYNHGKNLRICRTQPTQILIF